LSLQRWSHVPQPLCCRPLRVDRDRARELDTGQPWACGCGGGSEIPPGGYWGVLRGWCRWSPAARLEVWSSHPHWPNPGTLSQRPCSGSCHRDRSRARPVPRSSPRSFHFPKLLPAPAMGLTERKYPLLWCLQDTATLEHVGCAYRRILLGGMCDSVCRCFHEPAV
jgi:hypothetical protein